MRARGTESRSVSLQYWGEGGREGGEGRDGRRGGREGWEGGKEGGMVEG